MGLVHLTDSHGIDISQTVQNSIESGDRVVFGGDLWDSHTISYKDQLSSFTKLIRLKKLYGDRLILIAGNHDFHYLNRDIEGSGYQSKHAYAIKHFMESNISSFQIAYLEDKYLFSHAGLGHSYISALVEKYGCLSVRDILEVSNRFPNEIYGVKTLTSERDPSTHIVNYHPLYGGHRSGPLWIRPECLETHPMLSGLVQVIGHTADSFVRKFKDRIINDVYDECKPIKLL